MLIICQLLSKKADDLYIDLSADCDDTFVVVVCQVEFNMHEIYQGSSQIMSST